MVIVSESVYINVSFTMDGQERIEKNHCFTFNTGQAAPSSLISLGGYPTSFSSMPQFKYTKELHACYICLC